ncbi:outer membrane protein assembly factor BamA [Oceanicella sp. SM1341]|uniref:outer membrane protein assembly factor BamA n=1 Tax=Oceanicella sp. SM1341 TaxID=1548889 RepID=UPI0013009EE8|nr:outer membrane protein assembly factor BamA [Oceanicella sp. SM1341]
MTMVNDRVARPRGMVRALCLATCAGLMTSTVPFWPVNAQSIQSSQRFDSIDVRGNRRIEAETVRLYSGLEAGQSLSAEDLNLASRKIFATGLFSDVNVRPEGSAVVIEVTENPTINRISFEGNDILDDETLNTIINERPRRAYTRGSAEADAQLIIDAYRQSGRYGAEVKPVIIQQPDNRVDLVFEIFEGEVTEVESITFVGNEHVSDRRLRRTIQTQEANLLSFLFTSDNYDPDRLELDKQMLRRYYLENGFVDFTVLSAAAELSVDRTGFYVTFAVDEGEQYSYGPSTVSTQAAGLDVSQFEPLIQTQEGDTYNIREVERTVDEMTFLAGQQGYAFIQVRPQVVKDEVNNTVSIDYQLVEGPKVYIERIDIRGNTSTLDRVIRRQFDVVEGDAFDSRALQRARQNISDLDYFETEEVNVEPGSDDDRAVVVVDVEEKLTGSLSFGVGYSSSDGPIGSFVIAEDNFLGRGQQVSTQFVISGDYQSVAFDFFEPALLDRDLGAGFNVYYRQTDRTDESSYNETNIGFEPRIVFPLSETGDLEVRYRISQDEIDPIDRRGTQHTSEFIKAEAGTRLTSSIGYTYTWDLRDDPVETREGWLMKLSQDFAGLGGDSFYVKNVASAKAFTSFFDGDLVFSAEVEGGALISFSDDTTVTERFFLGGDTFRGFTYGGFGPRDRGTDFSGAGVDDALGGNFYAVTRLQASFPLGLPEDYGLYGGFFTDIGTLWGLDSTSVTSANGNQTRTVDDSAQLRAAVGVSLFWDSTFGPLRFNLAYPVVSEDGDDKEYFRFTAGTRF